MLKWWRYRKTVRAIRKLEGRRLRILLEIARDPELIARVELMLFVQ